MAGRGSKYLRPIVGLLIVSLLAGGCHRETTPEAKQARLIAAESMQLEKQLADLENQIGKLKVEHAKDIEKRASQLDVCRKRTEVLEADLRKGIAERVNSVTAAVMDENARLRQEIQQLRAEIETLEARLSHAP